MNIETRYTVDSKGRVRQWQCWSGEKEGKPGIFYTDGLVTGKMKDPIFKEAKEKNIGKANYISPEAQSLLMVAQEVGKKERSNYFVTPELARENKLWLPMLCPSGMKWKDYAGTNKVSYPAFATPKLDGARCNMFLKDGKVYSQTRTGKQWLNNAHIERALEPFFKANPDIILDGELYNHDFRDNFEDLMSIIKKQKPTEGQRRFAEENVEYHLYDIIDRRVPSELACDRVSVLSNTFDENPKFHPFESNLVGLRGITPVESEEVFNEKEFDDFHASCLEQGYEGSILRLNQEYKVDGRAKQLLKRKELFDAEFKIIDVIEGEGTNKGIAAKIIIDNTTVSGMNTEHLKLMTTKSQDAGMAKGWDHDKCRELLENKNDVIGMMATIEYFEVTSHGVLRFPKFKAIRDYD